jgi:hypothetical protein
MKWGVFFQPYLRKLIIWRTSAQICFWKVVSKGGLLLWPSPKIEAMFHMIRTRGTVLVYKTYGFPSLGPKVLPLTKITNLNLICKIHTPVAYHEASTNTFFFYCSPGIKHNLYSQILTGFTATFNNISVISLQSVLLMEETGVPGESHRPITSHWQTWSHNVISSTPHLSIGSLKSNYHSITTMTAPKSYRKFLFSQ